MRVFFGLEPDTATALAIASWRERQLAVSGRPVPAANFHITLAFVGELRTGELERLCLDVDAWCSHTAPRGGRLQLDRVGYWHKPGIFWLGASVWPDELGAAAEKLRHLASSVGGKRDKNPLQPHITLYRGCDRPPAAPPDVPVFSFGYQHLSLFESRPGRSGVSYHVLQDWELR